MYTPSLNFVYDRVFWISVQYKPNNSEAPSLGVKTYKKKKERKKKKNRIAFSVEIHEVEFILPKLCVRYQNEV